VEEQCRITNIIKCFKLRPSKVTAWTDSTTEHKDSMTQRYGNTYYEHEIINHSKIITRYLPTRMQVKVKQSHYDQHSPYFLITPLFLLLLPWRCDPTRVMAFSSLRFLDHTQRNTSVGRTPLDE